MKKDRPIIYKHSQAIPSLLKAMPKLELHRHLEGSYPIQTLFEIAQKNKIEVPSSIEEFKKSFQFPKDHEPDFLLFLSKFKKFWYKDIEDIAKISYSTVESFADENLFYTELRFNPLHFTELTDLNPQDVIKTVINSCDEAARNHNIQIRYILTFNRGVQTPAEMIDCYQMFKEADLSRVVGIDLAGDELNFPPEFFVPFFDVVKKDGNFGIDIHAGEISDSKNIWIAVEQLHATRIGHGVSAVFDKKLQGILRRKKIFLAQCITSNYQTGAWGDEASHPMKELCESNVPITIASDDPTIQDSDLTDDYQKTILHFNWNIEKLIQINLNAIEGTFLPKQEKQILQKQYKKAATQFLKKNKTAIASLCKTENL